MPIKENKKCTTSIGGQAVIEGVMMRGKTALATAVRDDSGKIIVESSRLTPPEKQNKFLKLPLVRGVVSLFSSLITGTKILMRSASVFGDDETSDFDNIIKNGKKKSSSFDFAIYLSVFIGLALSLFLFFFLPQKIADLLTFIEKDSVWYFLVEGLVRIIIFISYVLLTSLLKDIRRTYMYHGAEHKTISAYENGLELTVENVKKCSRVHNRCGTTFMFIVMTISILVFALVNSLLISINVTFEGVLGNAFRFIVKLACLPLVAGVSYEILKAISKTQSKWVYVLKLPGLLLQRLTTREPDDEMIEVAIKAFNTVLEMDNDQSIKTTKFEVSGSVATLTEKVKKAFSKKGIDSSDAEWLVAITLNVKRSEVYNKKITVTPKQVEEVAMLSVKRLSGMPLSYVLGNANFYGYDFIVNENVLIPRAETEELVAITLKNINSNTTVLDMCTGSGAIAITINKQSNATVTAVDISEKALEIAKVNAKNNGANVNFIQSDMFNNVSGKFDVIISNPPYVKSSDIENLQREVKFEPIIALDGGQDGLDFYRIIANDGAKFLNDGGLLFIEYGINESEQIKDILIASNNFKNVEIIKDINGLDRIIKAEKV